MGTVFRHGRLRLYLLRLLDQGPRHGYELIRLLEQRFDGHYAPSAGTVYPRLQRLDAAGLVRHATTGGRKVYEITDAGRAELARRAAELAALECELTAAAARLAAADPPPPGRAAPLDGAAPQGEAVPPGGAAPLAEVVPPGGAPPLGRAVPRGAAPLGRAVPQGGTTPLERRLAAFTANVRGLADGVRLSDDQLRAIGETLDAARDRLRRQLRP